jgi:protocatechuate 3,4-dioxygenase beta subunit
MTRALVVLLGLSGVLAFSDSGLAQQPQVPSLIPPIYLAPRFVAPSDAPSSIVIAAKEPGERLVVTGRVLNGTQPVTGASIYVVQAAADGRYSNENPDRDLNASVRVYGWMRSGAKGEYRYETIRPGHYGRDNPAHVHYVVNAAGYKPRMFDLRFDDDPIIAARRKAGRPDDDGPAPGWVVVRPVTRDANGVWHVTRDLEMVRE